VAAIFSARASDGAFLRVRAGPETVERALVDALRELFESLEPPLTEDFLLGMGLPS